MTLEVMLCGAADTGDFYDPFRKVISSVGGDAWYYQAGKILYKNSLTSTYAKNSQQTVQRVDACVFVVNEKYGEVTWSIELEEALDSGKPFTVLCRDTTYQTYDSIRRRELSDSVRTNEQQLIQALDRFTSRNLTLHTFALTKFESELRLALSQLFEHGLTSLHKEILRHNAIALAGSQDLTTPQLDRLLQVALDETEDKFIRKRALSALSNNGGLDAATLLDLLDSTDQGVQRTVMRDLKSLYQERPVDPEFLAACVEVANRSDDVGLARRLIPALFSLDLTTSLHAMRTLDLGEIGARRRLATALEDNEDKIRAAGIQHLATEIGQRCVNKTSDIGWIARCRALLNRFANDINPVESTSHLPSNIE